MQLKFFQSVTITKYLVMLFLVFLFLFICCRCTDWLQITMKWSILWSGQTNVVFKVTFTESQQAQVVEVTEMQKTLSSKINPFWASAISSSSHSKCKVICGHLNFSGFWNWIKMEWRISDAKKKAIKWVPSLVYQSFPFCIHFLDIFHLIKTIRISKFKKKYTSSMPCYYFYARTMWGVNEQNLWIILAP